MTPLLHWHLRAPVKVNFYSCLDDLLAIKKNFKLLRPADTCIIGCRVRNVNKIKKIDAVYSNDTEYVYQSNL